MFTVVSAVCYDYRHIWFPKSSDNTSQKLVLIGRNWPLQWVPVMSYKSHVNVKCLTWHISSVFFGLCEVRCLFLLFKCSLCSWNKDRGGMLCVLLTLHRSFCLTLDLFILCLWSLLLKADPLEFSHMDKGKLPERDYTDRPVLGFPKASLDVRHCFHTSTSPSGFLWNVKRLL